ncbi:MAG: hypothetical protein AB7J28_06215 [Hyphomonadaceae bacterium]
MTTRQWSFSGQRALSGVAALFVGVAAGLFAILAAIAIAFVGAAVALAALAFRFIPRMRPRERAPLILEGRRTADGWVAEPAPR